MIGIDNITFGMIGRILSAMDGGRSHGYEIHKNTGITLPFIYRVLPTLADAGLLEIDLKPEKDGRKYVSLTENGKMQAKLYKSIQKKQTLLKRILEQKIVSLEDNTIQSHQVSSERYVQIESNVKDVPRIEVDINHRTNYAKEINGHSKLKKFVESR